MGSPTCGDHEGVAQRPAVKMMQAHNETSSPTFAVATYTTRLLHGMRPMSSTSRPPSWPSTAPDSNQHMSGHSLLACPPPHPSAQQQQLELPQATGFFSLPHYHSFPRFLVTLESGQQPFWPWRGSNVWPCCAAHFASPCLNVLQQRPMPIGTCMLHTPSRCTSIVSQIV